MSGIGQFLLTDQVGTLRAVADTSGAIVKRIDYDSFGNIIADSNPAFSVPFGFAGGLHDRDTGLVRFGYRDYSPELGRFTAKDPIDFAGGDTNLYAYVTNDPVNFIDPRGLDIWIEGPSGKEPPLHQNVNVGKPRGNYSSYSFGMNGNGLQGEVYPDPSHGGRIEAYKTTTQQQDAAFKAYLDSQLKITGTYGRDDICRSWSQRQFEIAPGETTPLIGPPVTFPITPSLPSTTGTSSSTGTGTSR